MPKWANRLSYIVEALKHRNYRLFFFGQAVSLIGMWMTRMATQWLVYRLTESPWMVGVVGFCQLAPAFCLSPLAGTMVDRWNRHTVLVITQIASMVISLMLAALALTDLIEVWQVLMLCAAEGAVRGFGIPARQALVVQLVEDRSTLPNAIALNSMTFNGARMVGPALGGIAVALVGEGLCFLIDGLSYIAVIAALIMMRLPKLEIAKKTTSVIREMGDGFKHTFGFAPYRAILMTAGLIILAGGAPQMALMSEFAKKVLGGDAGTFGILMSSSGGGALLAGVYLATRKSVRGLGNVIAGCAISFGVMLMIFAVSRNVIVACCALTLGGFAMMVVMAGSNTIMQTLVDDDKRGRVMALFVMTFTGCAPTGQLIAGAVAERIGTPWTIAIGGGVCILAGINFARMLPTLRNLARPIYIARGIIPPDPGEEHHAPPPVAEPVEAGAK